MVKSVLAVIGAGGMGEACVRRLGSGHSVVLGDADERKLQRVASSLLADGFEVIAHHVDVTARASVRAFAQSAARAGSVLRIVHTAGLSPLQGNVETILRVDLYGVALVLDEFAEVVAEGGAGVVIASMAGHLMPALPVEDERALRATSTVQLLDLPCVKAHGAQGTGGAYAFAKHASSLRVMAASTGWGRRRARINAISPGVIATPQGQQELSGPAGERMRSMIAASGTGRIGTPNDIAEAAAFLLDATFITGIDLLVDGGIVAALRSR